MHSETADFVSGAATWRTGRNIRVVFDFGALCENMTSSTKPEVYNVLHCRQRRTEPRPKATCVENLVKFGHVVLLYASEQRDRETNKQTNRPTDRHTDTDMLIATLRAPSEDEVNNVVM